MDDIKIERSRSDSRRYTVYGPYERDYGRQHYGNVSKIGDRFFSFGTDGIEISQFSTRKAAVASVVRWAAENLSAESVLNDFETTTRGGHPVTFLRRVKSVASTSVVAILHSPEGRVQMAWKGDGSRPFEDEETELDLVPRSHDPNLGFMPTTDRN